MRDLCEKKEKVSKDARRRAFNYILRYVSSTMLFWKADGQIGPFGQIFPAFRAKETDHDKHMGLL